MDLRQAQSVFLWPYLICVFHFQPIIYSASRQTYFVWSTVDSVFPEYINIRYELRHAVSQHVLATNVFLQYFRMLYLFFQNENIMTSSQDHIGWETLGICVRAKIFQKHASMC